MTDCTYEVYIAARASDPYPDIIVTIDTDSWLDAEFERDEQLDAMLDDFRAANFDMDEGQIMAAFPRYVYDRQMIVYNALSEDEQSSEITPTEPTGYYGEGEPVQVFTPNVDNFLSIDVQFVMWGNQDGMWAVLRKADAYNGYGDATAYRVLGDDGTEPLDFAQAYLACDGGTNPHPNQLTVDGSHWAPCQAVWDHVPGHNGVDQGHGYGVLPGYRETGDYPFEEGTEPRVGVLVLDTDEDVAYCPVCGSGKLIAGKF